MAPDPESTNRVWPEEIQAFWSGFRRSTSGLPEAPAGVDQFGDDGPLADELLALVVEGTKRATATLVAELEHEQDPFPRLGDYWIVCDGEHRPRVVVQTIELRLGPVASVDDRFAWIEGEGDRSRADWLRLHGDYWRRRSHVLGIDYHDGLEAVFEVFRVVWPSELADPT